MYSMSYFSSVFFLCLCNIIQIDDVDIKMNIGLFFQAQLLFAFFALFRISPTSSCTVVQGHI